MPTKKKATNQDIYNEIISIREYLARNEHYYETVKKLDERVNGNGKPGLVQEMALVHEREQKRDRREWLVMTVLVAEIIGFAFSLIG